MREEKSAPSAACLSTSRATHQDTSPATPTVDVAAGLVFREGKLLIALRHPAAHLGGLWEFPGGKREPGESFEACLARELREELGIKVTVGELVESLTHEYPGKVVHLQFYRCVWKEHEPQALGCAEFAWVGPAELRKYAFPAADERLLEKLQREMELWR
jgi:mutator protein MutT